MGFALIDSRGVKKNARRNSFLVPPEAPARDRPLISAERGPRVINPLFDRRATPLQRGVVNESLRY